MVLSYMGKKYLGFKDLPPDVAERLRLKILENKIIPPDLPDLSSPDDMSRFSQEIKDPKYTQSDLIKIIEAFSRFNNAVQRGLPNQLYEMFFKTLDSNFGRLAYAAYLLWCTYEDRGETAKQMVKEFAEQMNTEIDKRSGWSLERHNKEYRLDESKNVKMAKKLSKLIGLETSCFGIDKKGYRVLETPRKVKVAIKRSNGFTENNCDLYNHETYKCNAEKSEKNKGFCYLQMEKIGLPVTSAKVLECAGTSRNKEIASETPENIIAVRFLRGLHMPLCRAYQNGRGECATRSGFEDCYHVQESELIE